MRSIFSAAAAVIFLFSAIFPQPAEKAPSPPYPGNSAEFFENMFLPGDRPGPGSREVWKTPRQRHGLLPFENQDPFPEAGNLPFSKSPVEYIPYSLPDGVQEAWASHYNAGTTKSKAWPAAMAIDGQGNVYVSGYTLKNDPPFHAECYTIMYNSSGTEIWNVRYSEGNDNVPAAIRLDAAGNVYITGYGSSPHSPIDYLTIKYNSAGIEQWAARYNGPANGDDRATALALDGAGNVYVTGASEGSGTASDYLTVKYNSAGVEQWVARYNGPGNGTDRPAALALDGAGNVYVTGASEGSGTASDYLTVKYNSAGVEQWAARYNGPVNRNDQATAWELDGAGNVYVTGLTENSASAYVYDYLTIKYTSEGMQQWAAFYNGPVNGSDQATALALDGAGNVYVTGTSGGSGTASDYATVKYNSAGVEQWAARYNGPGNSYDRATALALDGVGNVYVTGASEGFGTASDYATVKYNTAGIELWVARYNGPANSYDRATTLALDGVGNLFVTGESAFDQATVKYNSAGAEQWVARYASPAAFSDITAIAMAMDRNGNVYVTGNEYNSITYQLNYLTVKYNSAGVLQWVARYSDPEKYSVVVTALAVDALENVYVTGYSDGFTPTGEAYSHYLTVKYNSAGVEQWAARYDGSPGLYDQAVALAVDGSGNVYVTGNNEGSVSDYATVKYNSAGVQQWAARYNGPANGNDRATALALDGARNVYVTGFSYGTLLDYLTVKYNSAGEQQWEARYNGPANGHDHPRALAVDRAGNVYVTGRSDGSGTNSDYLTVKYNSAGVEQWTARYNGLGNSYDRATALALDEAGNVYVAGESQRVGTADDFATVKYNSAGVEQWEARYNGPGNSDDRPAALAVDRSGSVYVSGSSWGSETFSDYVTLKYNSSGEQQWEIRYNGPENHLNEVAGMAVDLVGNILVSGTSSGTSTAGWWRVYTTIKYIQNPGDITPPQNYRLRQNYPNPFNLYTIIPFELPEDSEVELEIFNISGEKVAVLASGPEAAGEYEIVWKTENTASGIYICRLSGKSRIAGGKGKFVETRKMVLLK